MQLFLDSANIDHIEKYKDIIDGVTTNSSMKVNRDTIINILNILNDKQLLHVQINSYDYNVLCSEAYTLLSIDSKRIIIKIPMSLNGLRACKQINGKINMTLCFNIRQIYSSFSAHANYISLFIGRMHDNNIDYQTILQNSAKYSSKILAASIRTKEVFNEMIRYNLGAITIPEKLMNDLYYDELTHEGFEKFNH